MARCSCLVGLVIFLLVGCGQSEPLPPPGATDGVIHMWRAGSTQASVLRCERMVQVGPDPQELNLFGVRVVLPLADGVVHLSATSGQYRALQEDPLQLQGPVALSGSQAGAPFTGHAAGAALVAGGAQVVLTDVTLVQNGQHLAFNEIVVDDVWGQAVAAGAQGLTSESAALTVTAALLALPPPSVALP